ncbi:hypothetical protein [Rhodococcus coprophilus]|uniref:Uncharacterized protein n=1 Tax=Rhodococcus coprophilus TaxID=38310 RepID=A0A2X4X0R4_9NOCA|nr:hypothetical protein [Rhodococcus coprophilus]MBM7458579.1 uncharacterized coiled-coil DUF342 family protein [Rhodococcus coprophilus]SQI32925.1 Uncharacterised protein [Rhodococcus coprophilus]
MANIPENAQLHELPAYWQDRILKLRSEGFELRKRLHTAENFDTKSEKVRKLNNEAKNLRIRLRAAEARISELGAQLPDPCSS